MIFVGIDWAECQHGVWVIDADGQVLTKARIVEGLEGGTTVASRSAVALSVQVKLTRVRSAFVEMADPSTETVRAEELADQGPSLSSYTFAALKVAIPSAESSGAQ